MAIGLHDHLADRAIGRDRVAARQDGAEEEAAVVVGDEARPRRGADLVIIGLLGIVEAVVIGMRDE